MSNVINEGDLDGVWVGDKTGTITKGKYTIYNDIRNTWRVLAGNLLIGEFSTKEEARAFIDKNLT